MGRAYITVNRWLFVTLASTMIAALAPSVFADQDTLWIVADGDITGKVTKAGSTGCTNEFECIDENPHDSIITDLQYGTANDDTTLSKTAPLSIAAGNAIDSIVFVYADKRTAGTTSNLNQICKLSATLGVGTEKASGANWAVQSQAVGRPGGGVWQLADVNDTLQIGLFQSSSSGTKPTSAVSQLFAVVYYHAVGPTTQSIMPVPD